MAEVLCVQVIWDHAQPPLPEMRYRAGDYLINVRFNVLRTGPGDPEYPAGRKGLALASAWRTFGQAADGMLVRDGDVAIDPHILAQMMDAIGGDPESVWTAPARIWPAATHRPDWVWAHWDEKASQDIDDTPQWFSFCFTYLPRAVISRALQRGLRSWCYPHVDRRMAKAAQSAGVKVRVVPDCWPVHLHF